MNNVFKIKLLWVHLLAMLMLFNLTKAEKTCQLREPKISSQQFSSARDISRLKEDIISESRVLSWLHCGTSCLETRFCVGYNYKEKSKENENNCQLSHTTDHHFERVRNEENDWTFYEAAGERKSDSKDVNECQHNGTTAWDPVKPFKCNCLKGYEGELCERKTSFKGSRLVMKGKTCLEIKNSSLHATSGVHWIKPDTGSLLPYFKVYCDMETHGGGWTLVYSYTFTDYNNFNSGPNAVTPRPNWTAPTANVPISTTPPLNESSRGAVDYSLWKYIGNDVMIKSNINDWIVCQPNGGSLVTKKDGGVTCQNIKHVAPKCHNPPSKIYWIDPGPTFDQYLYFFDGQTTGWCPTHDFCGSCNDHKKGVSNPGGKIYVR